MVCSRLRDDYDTHHRHAVHLHVTLQVGSTQFGIADIAQTDNLAVHFLDDYVVEFFGGVHLSHGTQGKFHGISFDATRWKFHVLVVHGVFDVHGGDAVACHAYRVQPETHGVTFFSPDGYTTYIRDGLELLLHGQVGYFAQFQKRTAVALDGYHQDRAGVCIGLRHGRRVAIAGQVALGTRNLVAHVVGGRFQVDGQFKLYGNAALSLLAHAGKGTDARNTVDVLFQGFGYLVLDDVGIGSRIATGYGDNRIVDRRVFTYSQGGIPNHTEQQDDDGQYRGEYGSADTKFGNVHKAPGLVDVVEDDRHAGTELQGTCRQDGITDGQSAQNLNLGFSADTDFHVHRLGQAVPVNEYLVLSHFRYNGFGRDGDGILDFVLTQFDAGIASGKEFSLFIRIDGTYVQGMGRGVDTGFGGVDLCLVGIQFPFNLEGEIGAFPDLSGITFRHGEFHFQRSDSGQFGHHDTG